MASANATDLIRRFDAAEERWCVAFNRWSASEPTRAFFAVVSRLGNGLFWYVLILALPALFGSSAVIRTVQISITGIVGVLLYKWLKRRFVRERPYISHLGIRVGTVPLDRYSFPSGHTLHAVSFTILLSHYFPSLTWLTLPFAVLVALSRVVLGLHYPSDVAAGTVVGVGLALTSVALMA